MSLNAARYCNDCARCILEHEKAPEARNAFLVLSYLLFVLLCGYVSA